MTDYTMLTGEELAAMTRAERGDYYNALYNHVAKLITLFVPEDEPIVAPADEAPGEGGVYSAAGNLVEALLDVLAALTEMTEIPA